MKNHIFIIAIVCLATFISASQVEKALKQGHLSSSKSHGRERLHQFTRHSSSTLEIKSQTSSNTAPSGCVIVWGGQIGDSSQPHVTLCGDTKDLRFYGLDKHVGAIQVGPNVKAILCSDYNYNGNKMVFAADDNGQELKSFGEVSSIFLRESTVQQGCVVVWGGIIGDYEAGSEEICNSVPDLRAWCLDKQISSIQVGDNTQVVLWNDYNYKGSSYPLADDSSDVTLNDFDNQVSSIQIISDAATADLNVGCIRVWGGLIGDTTQPYAVICDDTPDLRVFGLDKQISAIEVGSNTVAVLCSDYKYGGAKFSIGVADNNNLLQQFNDFTSSIFLRSKIVPSGCIVVWGGLIGNYSNPSETICNNVPDLRAWCIDKAIQAVQVGQNTQVSMWSNYNYAGSSIQLNADDNFVRLQNFATSSISLNTVAPASNNVTIIGTITYATTGGFIPDSVLANNIVIVFVPSTGKNITATLLPNSKYSVTLPPGVYQRVASMANFITNVEVDNVTNSTDETNSFNNIMLAPVFVGWRFVLSWTDFGDDLDSYLQTPVGLVYFRSKKSSDGLSILDLDSRNSTMPETIQTQGKTGTFKYYAKRYSGNPISLSGAKLTVYHGSTQVKSYLVPQSSTDPTMLWSVFTLNADTQTLTDVNVLTTTVPS